jgi:hypothetical protein
MSKIRLVQKKREKFFFVSFFSSLFQGQSDLNEGGEEEKSSVPIFDYISKKNSLDLFF